jgi:hypothetical protein
MKRRWKQPRSYVSALLDPCWYTAPNPCRARHVAPVRPRPSGRARQAAPCFDRPVRTGAAV